MKKLLLLSLIIILLGACAPNPDLIKEEAAVEAALDRFTQAFETKNIDMFAEIFSHDPEMVNFGTDEDEYWIGWEPWRASFQKQFDVYEKSDMTLRDVRIKVHKAGQVAWFSALMDVQITSQGQGFDYTGMRVTGVLEKKEEGWVFTQRHVSVPVKGQAVEY